VPASRQVNSNPANSMRAFMIDLRVRGLRIGGGRSGSLLP
jgi:hypothetical protein